jgi:hypothetical protein
MGAQVLPGKKRHTRLNENKGLGTATPYHWITRVIDEVSEVLLVQSHLEPYLLGL